MRIELPVATYRLGRGYSDPVCNISVEADAKMGIVAPDEKTYEYLKGHSRAGQPR